MVASALDEGLQSNPLLQDFDFPPFDAVQAEHVRPWIRSLLKKLESDLEELERTVEASWPKLVEPLWPKLVEPLEKIIDRLTVVWEMINHLKTVKDTSELRATIAEVQPEKVKFQHRLRQSKPIYNAFKAIKGSPDWQSLSKARKHIVESQIQEAILNGVDLEDDKREQFNEIEQELERLSQKFGENVLDATKKFERLVTDKREIEGLPATAVGLAAQTAVSKGHENATAENGPWIITLDGLSFLSVMQHARNRALRKEVYLAYVTRASSGDLDNTPLIDQILKLRLEKAKLFNYNNYAEASMATKMATVDKVEEFLEKHQSAYRNAAVQDMENLKEFSKSQGASEANDLSHWDFSFWSERRRESTCGIYEEELRPYFSLPKVMDGLFNLAKMLFGIVISETTDALAPVWNSDVRFYRVKDSSGSPIAYFYFDPYSRPSEKRGDAWLDEVISRTHVLSRNSTTARLPIVYMVCNQTPQVGDKPSLMTFHEVETVFHEFGHALQHTLTKQDEGLVAGIRGIECDAVAEFMEGWCYHWDTFMGIAKHYETGQNLPQDLYLKLLAGKTYRAGSLSFCQFKFVSLDLELHTKYVPGVPESVYGVDQRVSQKTQVISPLPEDRFLCSFSHIFGGGYATRDYSDKKLGPIVYSDETRESKLNAEQRLGFFNKMSPIACAIRISVEIRDRDGDGGGDKKYDIIHGSGVFFDKNLILTCAHIIPKEDRIEAIYVVSFMPEVMSLNFVEYPRKFEAEIKNFDLELDIAVLEVKGGYEFPYGDIATSRPFVGQEVHAFTSPVSFFSYERGQVVSHRELLSEVPSVKIKGIRGRSGASGSGLLDSSGKILGILQAVRGCNTRAAIVYDMNIHGFANGGSLLRKAE